MDDWKKPTLAQRRLHRTVFRIQFLANKLKEDLYKSGGDLFESLTTILFVQRDAAETLSDHGSGDEPPKRAYNANCCATYCFTAAVIAELRSACRVRRYNKVQGMTRRRLESLFAAYEKAEKKAAGFEAFARAIQSPEPRQLAKAHESLVEAAAAIPFRGSLPSTFDLELEKFPSDYQAGIWFKYHNREHKVSVYRAGDWSWIDEEKRVVLVDEQIEAATSESFDHFLNGFLSGDQPAKKPPCYAAEQPEFQGLALPVYERWVTKDERQGAFLGWLFLRFSSLAKEPAMTEFDETILRLTTNHFADGVLEAVFQEVIREYPAHEDKKPLLETFSDYVSRIEGWTIVRQGIKRTLAKGELGLSIDPREGAPVGFTIRKKWDTLPRVLPDDSEAKDKLIENLQVRAQRVYAGLEFYYGEEQNQATIEALKSYRRMFDLLRSPLAELTGAAAAMQRGTQELRGILYSPAEALFESYKQLESLFEQGTATDVGIVWVNGVSRATLSLTTRHNPAGYFGASAAAEEGRAVAAVAILRIFGRQEALGNVSSYPQLLVKGASLMDELETDDSPAFPGLISDLKWLANDFRPAAAKQPLRKIIEDDAASEQLLVNLKACVFEPFKVSLPEWTHRPLQLLLRRTGVMNSDRKTRADGFGLAEQPEPFRRMRDSPIQYHHLLKFVLACIHHQRHGDLRDSRNGLVEAKWEITRKPGSTEPLSQSITLGFCGAKFCGKDGVALLRGHLCEHVLNAPREWRVENTNYGDFTKPFVELANRIIGLETKWEQSSGNEHSVIELTSIDRASSMKRFSIEVYEEESRAIAIKFQYA